MVNHTLDFLIQRHEKVIGHYKFARMAMLLRNCSLMWGAVVFEEWGSAKTSQSAIGLVLLRNRLNFRCNTHIFSAEIGLEIFVLFGIWITTGSPWT